METIERPDAGEVETPLAPLSVAEHKNQFGPEALKATPVEEPPPATETPEQKVIREQKRDKESGQFKEGKVRHRAQSQKAGAEDVPRIQELTKKLRAAEERAAALEAKQTAPPPVHRPAPVQAVNTPAATGFTKPKPTLASYLEKDGTDWNAAHEQFADALTDWKQEKRDFDAAQTQTQAERTAGAERMRASWETRTTAAKAKYPDFQAVALEAPTRIPVGSLVDAFILEHKAGADVLYHYQRSEHAAELDTLLAQEPLDQLETLTLLAQRLTPSSASAGTTGAATGSKVVVLPPRPPTPVRTEAQRVSEGPPPTDGSLSLADHMKHFGPKRR